MSYIKTANLFLCDENGKIKDVQNNEEVFVSADPLLDQSSWDEMINEIKSICPAFKENGFGYLINDPKSMNRKYQEIRYGDSFSSKPIEYRNAIIALSQMFYECSSHSKEAYVRIEEI